MPHNPPARVGRRVPRNVYWFDEPLMAASGEQRAELLVTHLNALASVSLIEAQSLVDAVRQATNAIEYLMLSGSDHVG